MMEDAPSDDDEPLPWKFNQDNVRVKAIGAPFMSWQLRERFGLLPRAGGWQDQPLSLLIQTSAIDQVIKIFRRKNNPDEDWHGFTGFERNIIVWLTK